jgi:uncharacterized protein YheU (UPF0270 family)
MEIPYQQLKAETLEAIAKEFIMQEGTDYGHQDYSFDKKIEQVIKAVKNGKAVVVFDPKTESCHIKPKD